MRALRVVPLALAVAACATSRTSTPSTASSQTGGSPPAASSAGAVSTSARMELPLKHVATPTSGEILAGDLMTRLYVFADDSMLGREAGQLGNVKGTDYIAAEFRRLGLEPAGEDGGYFQTVPAIVSRADSVRVISVNGAPLALGRDVVPFLASNAPQTLPQGVAARTVDGARAIYGGQLGGTAPLVAPEQVRGKLVVFTVAPVAATGRRDWRFNGRGSLAAYGDAAGIAIVSLDILPAVRLAAYMGPMTTVRVTTGSAPAVGPTAMLVSPAAARRLLGTDVDAAVVGREGATVSGSVGFVTTGVPYPPRNVVAILRGSDPSLRMQYVAVGAHNDHIGISRRVLDHDSVESFNMVVRRQGIQDTVVTPTAEQWARINALRDSLRRVHGGVRRDSINNGADDDGSGTVALLEIAERFATDSMRPRRSILFVSHTGEEQGLWGSEWFTDHPTVPRDSIVAQLNMDMVGRGKPTDIMGRGPNNVQLIGPRRLSTQLGDLIDSLNARRTPRMDIDTSFDANGHPLNRYCRSDHYMYARYGIPITYFSLGYHTDYHQVTDEPQYEDYDHMARIAGFVHDIANAVANRPARLVVDKPKPDPRGGCRQ